MDIIVCLKSTVLAGSRESLIFSALCAVFLICLSLGVQRRLAQRVTVSVLVFFVILLLLGSVYVDCLKPSLI